MTNAGSQPPSGGESGDGQRLPRYRPASDRVASALLDGVAAFWRRAWVALVIAVVILALLLPEVLRQQLSRAQHTVLPWSISDELTGGLIRVTAPRVFTRERLVNDRFEEAAWLQDQLFETKRLLAEESFGRPDQIRVERISTGVHSGEQSVITGEGNDEPGLQAQFLSGAERWVLSREQQLDRAIGYRDKIRRRLMSENLDDTHDIDGNTLYRLDLAASITPPPYSDAVAIIEVQVKEVDLLRPTLTTPDTAEQVLNSPVFLAYAELLEEWRQETERHANRLLRDRLQIIQTGAPLSPEDTTQFNAYRTNEIKELLVFGTNEEEHSVEIDSWFFYNRIAFISFIFSEAVKDINKNLDNEEYKFAAVKETDFIMEDYRAICRNNYNMLDARTLQDLTGKIFSSSAIHRCILEPQNWQLIADLELLAGLRLIQGIVGKPHFQSCFRHFPTDFVDRFRVVGLDPDKSAEFRAGTEKWPPVRILNDFAQRTGCNFAIENDIFRNLYSLRIWERLRSEVARFVLFLVEGKKSRNWEALSLGEYFDFNFKNCGILDCVVQVEHRVPPFNDNVDDQLHAIAAQADTYMRDRNDIVDKFYRRLNDGARALAYSVVPDQELQYADEASTQGLVLHVDNLGRPIVVRSESTTHGINAISGTVGFGDWGRKHDQAHPNQTTVGKQTRRNRRTVSKNTDQPKSAQWIGPQTKFGWYVYSGAGNIREASPAPRHVPLSALVSLPSWWRKIDVTITSCWASRARLGSVNTSEAACADRDDMRQTMSLNLPGTAIDVSQRLMYEVVKYPFVNAPDNTLEVEAGRHASLAISGGRLWKSPRVQLGHQWADRVQVLPDMHGIIADFKCIEPPRGFAFEGASRYGPQNNGQAQQYESQANNGATMPQYDRAENTATPSDDGEPDKPATSSTAVSNRREAIPHRSGGGQRMNPGFLRIWTSEGVTQPLPVSYVQFQRRYGNSSDEPCLRELPAWLENERPGPQAGIAGAAEPPSSAPGSSSAPASD
jgi:hypothetical protein